MSKNIFSVLAHDDSDDEAKPKQPEAPKVTKKEKREKDQQLREHFGDQVQKDSVSHKRNDNAPKNKGDYASGERRPFERHSGTGKPAFARNFKKGGFGKGNVGANENNKEAAPEDAQPKEGENNQEAPKEQKPVEEVEQIISAEEYIAKSGLNYNFLQGEQEVKNVNPPVVNDPNLKVVNQKAKDQHALPLKKAKNPENLIHSSKNIMDVQGNQRNTFGRRRNSPQQNKRVEYNEVNFPSLS